MRALWEAWVVDHTLAKAVGGVLDGPALPVIDAGALQVLVEVHAGPLIHVHLHSNTLASHDGPPLKRMPEGDIRRLTSPVAHACQANAAESLDALMARHKEFLYRWVDACKTDVEGQQAHTLPKLSTVVPVLMGLYQRLVWGR